MKSDLFTNSIIIEKILSFIIFWHNRDVYIDIGEKRHFLSEKGIMYMSIILITFILMIIFNILKWKLSVVLSKFITAFSNHCIGNINRYTWKICVLISLTLVSFYERLWLLFSWDVRLACLVWTHSLSSQSAETIVKRLWWISS